MIQRILNMRKAENSQGPKFRIMIMPDDSFKGMWDLLITL